MSKRTLLILGGFLVLGCGASLTTEGARVKIAASVAELGTCQPISNVDGKAGNKEDAEIVLRNNAGKMNADNVVVSDTLEGSGEVKMVGKAYSCSAAQNGGQ